MIICRRKIVFKVLLIFCFLSIYSGTIIANGKPKPHIIVITVDDLGWSGLSCTGSSYYETKYIDKLAEQGVRFTNAYAAASICSPTRAALLTGKYPARTGITDWIRAELDGKNLPSNTKNPTEYVSEAGKPLQCPPNPLFMELQEKTIAEYLKQEDYVTCHVGKWHLGPEEWYPTKQGFDYNIAGCGLGFPPSYFDPYETSNFNIPTLKPREKGEFLTDRLGDEVVNFIKSNADKPFFINWNPYAVHRPLQGKKELINKYKNKRGDHHNNPVYAALTESVDENIGKMLECLDNLNLTQNTLIIFTSDNGGLLPVTSNLSAITSNLPLRSGKGYPYEGGLRVPLIIKWPGIAKPGTLSNEPVITMDIFTTILEASGFGATAKSQGDGLSLLPVLKNSNYNFDRDLFWHFPHYRQVPDGIPYSIIRSDNFKLITYYDGTENELYDLKNDPYELENLYKTKKLQATKLELKLKNWFDNVNAKLPRKFNGLSN